MWDVVAGPGARLLEDVDLVDAPTGLLGDVLESSKVEVAALGPLDDAEAEIDDDIWLSKG